MVAMHIQDYIQTELDRKVEHWLIHGSPPILILIGPSGVGKTITVCKVLDRHPELPKAEIYATWGARLEEFFGTWQLRPGPKGAETHFVEGVLLKGLKTKDCVIRIEDAHTIAPDLQLLNGVGDLTRKVSCPPLGCEVHVAEGVRLIITANPAPTDLPPWERARWEIPEQIRSRAQVVDPEVVLTKEDWEAIASLHWSEGHPKELLEGLIEVTWNLRGSGVLRSYTPSVRDLVMICQLIAQGLSLGTAFIEGLANKFIQREEREAAIEAFRAKFDVDPIEGSVLEGGK